MHDLIIRGGSIVDGTGAPAFSGDVAISEGCIREVGRVEGRARQTLNADGLLVTPGWVDIHTHYDGQATWDPLLTPSFWHGVTSVAMGNCGVGFAPAAPDRHDWLIGLMEGVEDIPGTALAEGIRWEWESFPEYLDALEAMPRALDVAAQIPHGAVRGYVMGERGARNEPATAEDIEQMAEIIKQAIQAGALGVSTSRTIFHRAVDGEPVPGTFAAEDELLGMTRGLRELDAGLLELAPAGVMGEDLAAPEKEVAWMRKLSAYVQRPVTFALAQHNVEPTQWRRMLELCDEAADDGANLVPQVASRPTMLLLGHQTFHPFMYKPSYRALAELPLDQRVRELRKNEVRRRLLEETPVDEDPLMFLVHNGLNKIFPLGDPPMYEPSPESSVSAIAEREGRNVYDVLYDLMLELDSRQFLMLALLNYAEGDLEALRTMLEHPRSAFGLGDGGAHCGAICDASMTTFLLTHWVRDRTRGPRLPLEWTVKKMTRDTARLYGMEDRGVLAPGYRADVNLIDFARLRLGLPQMVHDLPAGARRLIQRAEGYEATLVHGEVIQRNGEETGARPGRVIRGAQPAPGA